MRPYIQIVGSTLKRGLTVFKRCYSHKIPKLGIPDKYFVTTPIYYINSSPHIGHLYTNVLADVAGRWNGQVLGIPTKLTTGTDEHGSKILKAAIHHKEPVEKFCDKISEKFKNLSDLANINYTDFIRTTDATHCKTVQDVWTKLKERNFIQEGSYEGWYSVSDETFVDEDQVEEVEINGEKKKVFKLSGHVVEWVKEKNYVFRLSEFSDRLLEYLDSNAVSPDYYTQTLKEWIGKGLPDLSVSRDRTKNPWGIQVPDDPTQTIYVWLDALTNYLTTSGYLTDNCCWPVDCHVVGKDIIKFHAVYWPAFLMALGLELPKKIICHSHWQINKEKMSKSKGNVVDPIQKMSTYGVDGLRYYLMKDGSIQGDSNYDDARATECINSDLVNTFGNLLSRSTGKSINPEQKFPSLDNDTFNNLVSIEDREAFMNLYSLGDKVDPHYRNFAVNKALEEIMAQLYLVNGLFHKYKPWSLSKQEAECIIYLSLETVRVTSLALQPVVPQLACKALDRLGIPKEERTWSFMTGPIRIENEKKLGDNTGLILERLKVSNR